MSDTIAAIVDEWFQGEPTVGRQKNFRRTVLIRELERHVALKLARIADQIEEIDPGSCGTGVGAAKTMQQLAAEAVRAGGAAL